MNKYLGLTIVLIAILAYFQYRLGNVNLLSGGNVAVKRFELEKNAEEMLKDTLNHPEGTSSENEHLDTNTSGEHNIDGKFNINLCILKRTCSRMNFQGSF